jgi:hypothetical protein
MSGTKRKGSGEHPDLSHHPTRKVDSMSSLVAEMLLRDPDADATSPGLPAVNGATALDPENDSDAHDAVGLEMARLIEVRSSVAPPAPVAPSVSTADDSADIRAFRSRKPRIVVVVAVLCVVGGAVAAALSLSR